MALFGASTVRLKARRAALASHIALFAAAALLGGVEADAAAAFINISQVPLTVTIPAHPQVIIAIGNSESMDGSLSGAIMTGSGSLGATYSLLQNSSSPQNFPATAGFTPPVTGGTGTSGPYTSWVGSTRVDNSPSRLNVAKGAVTSLLNSFMANTDFALMDYKTSSVGRYTTSVYEMSPDGSGFVFTNTQAAGSRYVANPCQNYKSLASTNPVYQNCSAIDTSGQVTGDVSASQWMQVSASSDDPLINDVLYWGGSSSVCLVYGGPSPANPWPPNFSLSQYNSSPTNIHESYSSQVNSCARTTYPTNAGFVPYTQQTMYILRGFGYGGSQSAAPPSNSYWSPLVGMTSAGQNPTAASVSTAIAKFTPYLAPETDSTSTTEIKASAGQSALPGLLANAKNYYQYKNPASSIVGCSAQRYVILLTDGLPTLDLNGKSWPPPGTVAAANYNMTVNFNANGSLDTSNTNDGALLDTIATLKSLDDAGIKTYIIGLGAGVDPTQNPVAANVLKAMAIAGGTSDYFAAKDPVTLISSLNVILAKIQQATQSTSSSAVNSSGIHYGSVAYQAQFTTSDSYQDWTGNFLALPIDASTGAVNTDPASAVWSAQAQLDGQAWTTGRLIATWDPVTQTGIPFEWTTGTPTSGIASSTVLGQELSSNPADSSGQDALDYLRGDRDLEVRNGGSYRNRTHVLGDIVDSAPLYVGPPTSLSHTDTYATFAAHYASRPAVVYVGANDGMLHAFDATTGSERFAFIPNGVFANLIQLTYPLYNTQHQFFVDGSPEAWDVKFSDGSWHTVVASGENAGGKSIFALDVTDPATITSETALASRVLWEFTDANMGYTFSTPSLATTAAGSLIFFGNGYNSPTGRPFVYAVDPETGALKAKIDLCGKVPSACDLTKSNGLSTVTVANSSGVLSGTADVLYAGDLQGNVWRVDMSSSDPSLWTVSVLFTATDASGNRQPITTKLAVSLNPQFPRLTGLMVYVGTGQMLATADLGSSQTQSFYGIYDAMPNAATVVRSNLVQQTLSNTTITTVSGGTVNARTITSNAVPLPSDKGWYVDFTLATGERVITDPILDSGVLDVTSNQPGNNACAAEFNSWDNKFNYATGGSFPLAVFDVDESGVIDSSDQVVASVYLGNVFASSVRVRTGSFGNGTADRDVLINESGINTAANAYTGAHMASCPPGGRCDPILNILGHGGTHARTAWWEIR